MPLGPSYDYAQIPPGAPRGPRTGPSHRGRSTALTGAHEITVPFDGLKPEQLRKGWHEGFSPYRNLADNEEVRWRAFQFGKHSIMNHFDKTRTYRYKWADWDYLMEGNSLYDWDNPEQVYSPKLFEMKENLKTRIVSAVLDTATGAGSWFRAKGRRRMTQRQEDLLTAWHDYLNDKNNLETRLEEVVDTMLAYGFFMLKTYWSHKVERVVRKRRTKEVTKQGVKWNTERWEEERIMYDGSEWELVDPYWAIVDVDQTQASKMLVCGDRSLMTFDRIAELGEQKIFLNWRELEEQEPIRWLDSYGDFQRESRSEPLRYEHFEYARRPVGAPKEFLVDEFWGRFDPFGTGRTREMVIVIANGNTVLRVQENPYDDKHRPYCFGRATKKAFSFYGATGLDLCIPLQIEIDTLRSLAKTGTHLSVAPYVFVDDKEGLPETLWSAPPGKIFEVPKGSVEFTSIESPVDKMFRAQQVIERDMEGASGAPKLYSAAEGRTTATQYVGRQQEANQRIRGYIRNVVDGLNQLLLQQHSLCAQYLTNAREFRVLGKAAKGLRTYEEVNPEMFDAEIDFEFVVANKLNVVGMEATNMQLYANAITPFLPMLGDKFNHAEFAYRFGQLLGVTGIPGQEIVTVPQDPGAVMQPQDVLVLILAGEHVPVSEEDDHEEHIEFFETVLESEMFDKLPEHIQGMIVERLMAHQFEMDRQRRLDAARERQAEAAAVGGYPGQGSPPATGVNLQRRMSALDGGGGSPAVTPRGETPGPLNGAQIASPGRAQGFSQTQNEGFGFGGLG